MAQGAFASLPANGNGTTGLTKEELHEILECEKIVRFRDAVYSGSHPRIKIPPHLAGKPLRKTSSPITHITRPIPPSNAAALLSTGTEGYKDAEKGSQGDNLSNGRRLVAERTVATMPGAGKTNKSEINPILLEKSEDLIKAEIQLRRQRLERNLREQVEQRRISMKAALQTSESLPDFDLSDVLSKALTIVHPATASEAGQSVGVRSIASDSFDENTFYSSRHDTPEPSISSEGRRESGEIRPHAVPPLITHDRGPSPTHYQYESQNDMMTGVSLSTTAVPGLQELACKQVSTPLHIPQEIRPSQPAKLAGNAADISQQNETAKTDFYSGVDATNAVQRLASAKQDTNGAFAISSTSNISTSQKRKATSPIEIDEEIVGSLPGPADISGQAASANLQKGPLSVEEPEDVRNFNLSPVAPQPVRVSPLATARAPPIAQHTFALQESSTAPFSPLRGPADGSASDGSPKTSKQSGKKGKKKKTGRKSTTGNISAAVASPDSPYIKPEPKSPSPFTSAPLPRPHKRQRQALQQGAELNYDEPRYDEPRDEPQGQPVQSRQMDARPRPTYKGDERSYNPIEVDQPRYHRVPRDEPAHRRIVSQDVYRPPPSPNVYAIPYSQYEQRPLRAASRMMVDPYVQEPRYYREPPIASSTAIRMDATRERSRSPVLRERQSPILMAPPPRLATSRIVIDEYGRQYYTAVPSLSRQSVAPQSRIIEQDFIYDRPPPRIIGRPVQQIYEDDGVVYRQPSPQYVPQRRVVTLPENLIEPQSYRQREYSTRPMPARPPADDYLATGEGEPIEIRQREYSTRPPPPRSPVDDYVRLAEPVQRRQMTHFEEPPREYQSRMGSVRPEGFRHEVPREYIVRAQMSRPESIRREYAASVRPEGRREIPSQIIREYSMRPGEAEMVRQEYMPPPMDGYQPARPAARRIAEESVYIPRREMQQDVYQDDVRQEPMYR
jgi:hypothetical protein